MKANYKIEAGDVRVIRPLCYAREALMKDFARSNRLPVVNENCPACFEEPKERHRVKKVRPRAAIEVCHTKRFAPRAASGIASFCLEILPTDDASQALIPFGISCILRSVPA